MDLIVTEAFVALRENDPNGKAAGEKSDEVKCLYGGIVVVTRDSLFRYCKYSKLATSVYPSIGR